MKKTIVGVHGADGRMGIEICKIIQADKDLELVVDMKASKPEVVIDFTAPEGAVEVAAWCAEKGVALICGTTGLTPDQEAALKKASTKVPVLHSPNMSLGINALARAIQTFMRMTPGWDVAIEDIHHRHKKDSPSGTAKFFYNVINEESAGKSRVAEPVSIRAGEVFGIHKIFFFGSFMMYKD